MIKVCDALPGSGKTSACIRMMNGRTENRFVFATQYLSEVERIKRACSSRGFASPEKSFSTGFRKLNAIEQLICAGENIATTHALFLNSTDEIKQAIKDGHYILVLDEVVDVTAVSRLAQCDVDVLVRGDVLGEEDDGSFSWNFDDYGKDGEGLFIEEMKLAKSKSFLHYGDKYFFWAVPPSLFSCFEEVYVLTYLFEGQNLRCFFDAHSLPYEYIGVRKVSSEYEFCPTYLSGRAVELRDKIHILESEKLNAIGAGRGSLSFNWYRRHLNSDDDTTIDVIRKNLANLFRNVWGCRSDEAMWTTFKSAEPRLKGKGYWNSFVTYNKRATNEYAGRRFLAYCVNNFPRPWEAKYYADRGVIVNGNAYALSILVQWVFRSAIRNGGDVWLYIPSLRMRKLFRKWLDCLAEGRDMHMDLQDEQEGGKPKGRKPRKRRRVFMRGGADE